MQNRDALGISIEVPDPPVVRRRPSAGVNRRVQSQSAGELSQSPRNRLSMAGTLIGSRIGSYADQYRRDQLAGLPDLLTKGISDINGAVYNTVTEIRVRTFTSR